MNNMNIKYACFTASIFLLCINVFAQQKVKSFDIFSAQTDDYSIVKINTNTNEQLLLIEQYYQSPYFCIVSIKKDTIIIDTIQNIPIKYIHNQDTSYYYLAVLSNSLYYINDTLFFFSNNAIVSYIKVNGHFNYNDCVYLDENIQLSNIVSYHNNTLILSNQYFDGNKNYTIAIYDIPTNKIIKQKEIEVGNSILLHYYDVYNAFCSNQKYISMMNTITPKLYLYDYNLNLLDSIDFTFNEDYKKTLFILDTNVAVNKTVVQPQYPKNIIMLLDNIELLNHYSNIKQMFVDDSTLLVITQRYKSDTCDIIKINIKNHIKEIILSYPKYGKISSYTALSQSSTIPLFNNGIFMDYSSDLDSDEKNIIYSIDLYYSDILDFKDNFIYLEDKKNKEIKVNVKDYDGVILFDDYFCKPCFSTDKRKYLLIYYSADIDKVRRLSLYNELKKLYPKSDIFFNQKNKFNVRRNTILSNIY